MSTPGPPGGACKPNGYIMRNSNGYMRLARGSPVRQPPRQLDILCDNTHFSGMPAKLKDEIRQSKPFASLEQEAFLSLGRTWAVLDHAFSEAIKPYGITLTQYNVLRILRGAGEAGLCRADIMQRLIAKVPDATRLLDRLEEAGLIARERGSADRRFVNTTITKAGLKLLASLDEPVQALHRRHLSDLTKSEQRSLIDLLARVRASV